MAYQQVTLADLQTALALKWESKPFWVAEEARLAINDALETWTMLTGRWKRRVILHTTANTYELALPAPILYRTRLTFNGRPLSGTGLEDLNNGRPRWREETTATGGAVATRPMVWAPVSLQLLVYWPADAVGKNTIVVDGVADVPRLVAGGDFVDLGEDDLSVLLGYALHVAALKKGGPWFAQTIPYYHTFLRAAAVENQLLTTSQAYRRALGLTLRDLKPIKRLTAPAAVAALVPGTSS